MGQGESTSTTLGDWPAEWFAESVATPAQLAKLAEIAALSPPDAFLTDVKVARAEKNGQMKFKKLSVSGHVSQPRVEFSRDLLPVDRADEPLPQDFYQKVFLPAKDENF